MTDDRIIDKLHNNPPSDLELLVQRLAESNKELLDRRDALVAAIARIPEVCEDEETSQKLTTYGVQLKSCNDALEAQRKLAKAPYDDQANAVQGFFRNKMQDLELGVVKLKALIKGYNNKKDEKARKEEEEKRQAELEAARKQREEADRLAQEAAMLDRAGLTESAEKTLQQAANVESQAIKIEQAAPVPVAPQSGMIRGSMGGTSSRSFKWKAEVTNMTEVDYEMLRPYMDPDAVLKATNAYMKIAVKQLKDGEEPKQIKGTRIFRDSNIAFRG